MACSHFLQSRDPKTGRMGCHLCRVNQNKARQGFESDGSYSRQGLEAGPRQGLTDEGSNSEAEAHKETASPPPSGTIFCLTCLLRNPCGNTVTGETIFDTKYECLKCGDFTPFTLAFKLES